MRFSKHAMIRMQQRGRSDDDIDAIMSFGTQTRDGYLLRRRDVDERTRALKKEIERLHRLRGWAVITGDGGAVVTLYPAHRKKQSRMLRR